MKNEGKPTLGDDCDGFDDFEKCHRTKLQYINFKNFSGIKGDYISRYLLYFFNFFFCLL